MTSMMQQIMFLQILVDFAHYREIVVCNNLIEQCEIN
jgi:hypothetical protein